jgi:general secretion pathway protein A
MYEQFFNLNVKPFELVPNPDFLFLSRSHKRALTHLDYGIKERIGFILLTGEVGSGKTTIIRNQIKELNGRVTVSKIFNTKVTSEQLISMVNEDFGLEVTGKDKVTLLRELNDFLIKQYADKCHPILIIDEAQNLTPDLLEEVRMLSNLETDKCKLLQIILVGQPELRRTIAQPELRQLRQRISISCHISPLTRKEMQEYIFHRLKIAGNSEAISFSDKTFNIIYDFSRGIPRLVNIICDFLLLSAFVEGTRELSPELVQEVIRELEREHKYWQDETLEKLFLGNEENAAPPATSQDGAFLKISRKNFLRIIQEMVNRMVKLEEDFAKSYLSESEKGEIFEKVSSSERSLHELSARTKAEISTISSSVKDALNELGKVRSLIGESEKRVQMKAKSKKKNFWKRMFS